MPVAIRDPLAIADNQPVQRKRWTREECDLLVEAGVLDPQRYELIEGELIESAPKNHPHMLAVMLLFEALTRIFGGRRVLQEPSIHLSPQDTPYSDPEADAVVLNRPYDGFATKANPEDILLVVEVSHTTLRMDTIRKAALYARAGIQDYWVLDIKGRRFIVHREPLDGVYQSITAFSEDEPVTPLAAPEASVRAAECLCQPGLASC